MNSRLGASKETVPPFATLAAALDARMFHVYGQVSSVRVEGGHTVQ